MRRATVWATESPPRTASRVGVTAAKALTRGPVWGDSTEVTQLNKVTSVESSTNGVLTGRDEGTHTHGEDCVGPREKGVPFPRGEASGRNQLCSFSISGPPECETVSARAVCYTA